MSTSRQEQGMRRHGQTRLYVISYDIPDDRRRDRVHRVLSGFGANVQRSVFECFLTGTQVAALRERLRREIDRREDHVRFYSLCQECEKRVETPAGTPLAEPQAFIV